LSGLSGYREDNDKSEYFDWRSVDGQYVGNIFQRDRNTLWLSSLNGITQYDGDFRYVGLENGESIPAPVVYASNEGTLWIGSYNGLYKNPQLGVFSNGTWVRNIQRQRKRIEADFSNVKDSRTSARDALGNIWLCDNSFLQRYDGEKWTDLSSNLRGAYVSVIKHDNRGSLWIGSGNKCLIRYDGREFKSYVHKKGGGALGIHDIAIDSNGEVLAIAGFGVYRVKESEWEEIDIDGFPVPGIERQFRQILIDDADRTWLVEANHGLYLLDGKEWQRFTGEGQLTGRSIETIEPADDGSILVSTSLKTSNGVSKTRFEIRGLKATRISADGK